MPHTTQFIDIIAHMIHLETHTHNKYETDNNYNRHYILPVNHLFVIKIKVHILNRLQDIEYYNNSQNIIIYVINHINGITENDLKSLARNSVNSEFK